MNHELGIPEWELNRSFASRRIAELAQASGLFLAHFEYRTALPLPEDWLPQGEEDLAPQWHNGILAEHKTSHFRNDLMIGSYHPQHQSAWSSHELCHGLVGFAWEPDASPFSHALAARLAELLPVTLFYFFDDASSRRCELHQFGRPLHGAPCLACERASQSGPRALDGQRMDEGLRFFEAELKAIDESRRVGRMVPHHHGVIDLASDAAQYVHAQLNRLQSRPFQRFIDVFFAPEQGWHPSFESLRARVQLLKDDLLGLRTCPPWSASPKTWIRQDLGMRLIQVAADSEGDVLAELDQMIERLASEDVDLNDLMSTYESLTEEFVLPDRETVFSTGYPMGSHSGRSVHQILEGLTSVCPLALNYLADEPESCLAVAEKFSQADGPQRRPLGHRFSDWLAQQGASTALELARFEATLCQPIPLDVYRVTLANISDDHGPLAIASDCRLIYLSNEAAQIADLGEGGAVLLAIQPNSSGELEIKIMDPELAEPLFNGQVDDPVTRALLLQLGILVPERYG